jgi:uncharacterized protein with PQ loop repeat
MIEFQFATLFVAVALYLDTLSYYRQIKKTLKTRKSNQVSSTSFLYKIAKALFALTGLAIYRNFIGVGMEVFMGLVYIVSLIIVCRYKPKQWRLFTWRLFR